MTEIELLKKLLSDMANIITGKQTDAEKIKALCVLLDNHWGKEGEL